MHCEEIIFHAPAHNQGQLTWWRSLAITRHLEGCPGCTQRYQAFLASRVVVTTKCQEAAPAHLEARIFEAIASPINLDPEHPW